MAPTVEAETPASVDAGESTTKTTSSFAPGESDLTYTSCYCEENVWKLAERMAPAAEAQGKELYAVFLSNPQQKMELWHQKIGGAPDGYVVWDYHVLLLQCSRDSDGKATNCSVWDFDTTLPFPSPLSAYAAKALRRPRFMQRRFRVVPCESFLRNFASDRSHMLDRHGRYQEAPPPYPAIVNADGETMTLGFFLDMRSPLVANGDHEAVEAAEADTNGGSTDRKGSFGVVMEEPDFLERFGVL